MSESLAAWQAFSGEVDSWAEEYDVPELDATSFWERPIHAHLYRFAQARMVSPWALLGVCLTRAVTAVPPWVVLPPLVGAHASLNLFVGLVGPSGGGKGAAEAAAADALPIEGIETASVGSGEGLAHMFAHRDSKGAVIRDRDAVLFTAPEVDQLAALGSRQGATLLPQLRSAWSGERLGFAYVDPAKRLPLERHSYRLSLVVGIQPGRAAPLLNDADGGTPQRFLWLPTTDPDAPQVTPSPPKPFKLLAPSWTRPAGASFYEVPVPSEAAWAVRSNRLSRLRGEGHALDGHAALGRLKTAAALAVLDGRQAVTSEDWTLSEVVHAVSLQTRRDVVTHLAAQAQRSNQARGRADGLRAAEAADSAAEHAERRVARTLLRRLPKSGATRADARRGTAHRDRQHFDGAVERLVAAGQLTIEQTEHGERLVPTGGTS